MNGNEMKFELAKTPDDIAQLLDVTGDNLDLTISGDRGQWVQFLMNAVMSDKSKVYVWIAKGDEVKGYMVLVDARVPPLTDYWVILHAYSSLNHFQTKKHFNKVRAWIKALGGKKIVMNTRTPDLMKHYGFEPEPYTSMYLEI